MADHILITQGGLFSTLQDRGRRGYQRYGISASGAMDMLSLATANTLVGNPLDMAAIEMTFTGVAARVDAPACRVSIAGAEGPITVNGKAADGYTSLDLERGDVLEIGTFRTGVRAYLAVQGGFDIPPTLGSLSTHSRSGIGGLNGRALISGDRLPLRPSLPSGPRLALPPPRRPDWSGPIRVVLGPQADMFSQAGIDTFLNSTYRVSQKTDRMGCQLDGPSIAHADGFNIISDGIMNGSVQVPGHGRPIVLLADRQSTGGYPKIATVIEADLPRIAQRRPGEEIRFQQVPIEQAVEITRQYRAQLQGMADRLEPVVEGVFGLTSERLLAANLISGVHSASAPAAQE
ncbi:biotin-dependent carboxyltransferase family protein [Rhodoligotrophos defluvii]|uniref:5-oxoprolinase subunit C family protein n=1 Tax=Rhodoligotrophos defluvii TaxID=2561934 RepID=UPI0010C96E8C|nr:biotin-dependent carboxyltransferase family protein [Rhodoligotrophos defluvii]